MSVPARVRAWASAWLEAYVPVFRRRRPTVGVELGAWLPGWALRLPPAAALPALTLLVNAGPVAHLAVLVVALAVYVWPAGPAPAAAVIGLALLLVVDPLPPSPAVAAIFVAALPAVLQYTAIVGRAGPLARVELAVFVPALPRYLLIQAVTQPLALAGQWLADREVLSGPRWILLPILAVLGLVLLGFGWLPRLHLGSTAAGSGPGGSHPSR